MDEADALFAELPEDVRAAFTLAHAAQLRALSGDNSGFAEAHTQVSKALTAVGIPQVTAPVVYPLASSYEGVQRAALAWSALKGLGAWPYACPSTAEARRRWLGIDPGGVLETEFVEIEHDGVATREPLWRALEIAHDVQRQGAILDALPNLTTLRALGELYRFGNGYRIDALLLLPAGNLRVLRELGDEGREWAIEQAESFPTGPEWLGSHLKVFVFLALMRAHVPIEARWAHVFPNVMGASREFLFECARAVPEENRAAVLGPHLRSIPWAVEMVAEFPSAALAKALLDGAEANSQRWNYFVEQLRELGKSKPGIAETVEAIVAATPKPIDLYVTRIAKPKQASELSPLERDQLRIAGRGYDEQDLDAEARLAADGSESSFRGSFEIRAIADAEGHPVFDAFLYMAGAGAIFRAGTTEEIAWLNQGGVVPAEENDALRLALQVAVGPKPLKSKQAARAKKSATSKKKKPPKKR